MYSSYYHELNQSIRDTIRFGIDPTDKDYSLLQKHLYLYMTLFYNESNGISNVFSISDNNTVEKV